MLPLSPRTIRLYLLLFASSEVSKLAFDIYKIQESSGTHHTNLLRGGYLQLEMKESLQVFQNSDPQDERTTNITSNNSSTKTILSNSKMSTIQKETEAILENVISNVPTKSPSFTLPSFRVASNAIEVDERLHLAGADLRPFFLPGCIPTVAIEITVDKENGFWTLQTIDKQNRTKTVGGDEFYITFTGSDAPDPKHPTAASVITDHENGTYRIEFIASPMNAKSSAPEGKINIYHEYTCGLGRLQPPAKDDWKSGGALNIIYQIDGVKTPPILPFKFPSPPPDLSQYNAVAAVGDSMIRQFVSESGNDTRNLHLKLCPGVLKASTIPEYVNCVKMAVEKIRSNTTQGTKNAILVGHFVWDILRDESTDDREHFLNQIEFCHLYIQEIRKLAPDFDVYWKSGSGMQLHEVHGRGRYHVRRVYYMSTWRAKRLHDMQVSLMQELNVPILDVYLLSYLSGDWLQPGDGRHYKSVFNQFLVNQFYPNLQRKY